MAINREEWNDVRTALLNREPDGVERLYRRLDAFRGLAPKRVSKQDFVHELLWRLLNRLTPVTTLRLQEIRDLGSYCARAARNLAQDMVERERAIGTIRHVDRPDQIALSQEIGIALEEVLASLSPIERKLPRRRNADLRPPGPARNPVRATKDARLLPATRAAAWCEP
ncbi:MAG: hypothetical protein CMJ83_15200 [Planctomycetes bacterium]|nr:hypothetical protein [Planctomycetota bacterium]